MAQCQWRVSGLQVLVNLFLYNLYASFLEVIRSKKGVSRRLTLDITIFVLGLFS